MQVRLASSRLPEKALLPLAGIPSIVHAMRALDAVPASHLVLLTDEASSSRLRPLAAECGYDLFVGDPDDLLRRYADAVRHYGVDTVVRATGDNPLVSAATAREALQLQDATGADYAGIIGTPYGTGVEVLRGPAILELDACSTDPTVREHVGPGFYGDTERFRVVTRKAAPTVYYPEMRVTLDTAADYNYIAGVFAALYRGVPIEVPELVAYGHQQHRNSA